MKYRVFIVDSAQVPHGEDDSIEREVLGECAGVQFLKLHSEEEFDPYSDKADAIILWHHLQVTARLLGRLSKTRLIVRNGVGYDNIDIDSAADSGIAVANVPDYGTEEVADHAITLALALIRQLKPLIADVAAGNWEWRTGLACRRIRGQTFAILGCGRIGTATALRAKALGFAVCFFDPHLPSGYDKAIGVERTSSLEELLAIADVLSIHIPLTEGTRHLIGKQAFARMKQSAYLINTARGPVVEYDALLEALSHERIAGAGMDVLEDEPAGIEALQRFPNCILTPHSAFYSRESLIEMRRKSAVIVRDALMHGRYGNVVNQRSRVLWRVPIGIANANFQ